MSPVCPATGHVSLESQGPRCADHGVQWFMDCPACGIMWPLEGPRKNFTGWELWDYGPERAHDFCATCGIPGPWVSRDKLIQWIRHQLQADMTMTSATRLELLAAMDRLQVMSPDDSKAIAGWEQIELLKDIDARWAVRQHPQSSL